MKTAITYYRAFTSGPGFSFMNRIGLLPFIPQWALMLRAAFLCFISLSSMRGGAKAASETILHNFQSNNTQDAFQPAALVSDGTALYGVCNNGGAKHLGAIYTMNTDGTGFQLLHSFDSASSGGYNPDFAMVLSGTTLYGVTTSGGTNGKGTVFKISTNGTGFQDIFSYSGTDLIRPSTPLVLSGTTLYGASERGGSHSYGALYQVNTDGTGYKVLYNFGSIANDGYYNGPLGGGNASGLVLSGGTIYGTTPLGGVAGWGAAFKINTDGTGYQILHSFYTFASDGANPSGVAVVGSTLCGTAPVGGAYNAGVLFKVNIDGSGYQITHHFQPAASDGARPYAGMVAVGNILYGVTINGGTSVYNGTVFQINVDGSGYQQLYSFGNVSNDGKYPQGPLVALNGILYGTTSEGGAYTYNNGSSYVGCGTIFSVGLPNPAGMTGLANGSTLGSTSASFTWDAGVGVTAYALWVGSTPGAYDLYSRIEGTSLLDTVNNLPADGSTVYVRLYSLINGVWVFNSYVYRAVDNRAQMTSPTNASALGASSANFSWSAGSGVSRYALWVGSIPGGTDFYAKFEDGPLSDTVGNLPTDGRTFYVTLWSLISGKWLPVSYEYTALDNRTQMTSPGRGTTLTSASATFSWGATAGASNYALWVGSNPGTYDLYFKIEGGGLSDTVSNLPVDGRPIYVRLYSLINGVWVFKSYTYTAVDNRAQMTSPASNGSALGASSVNFTWSAGTGVSQYALWVGSSPGGNDLYSRLEGASLSDTVSNLPVDGRPIYVTLWSYLNGKWVTNNYSYIALDNKAQMTSPANNSALGSSSVNFAWTAGTGVSQYALWVGSVPGAYDLYAKLEGSSLSDTVSIPSGLMDGHTIYVRLYSYMSGAWVFNSYVYTVPDNKAQMSSPAGGSALASGTATFSWSAGTGVSTYGIWVGSTPGAYDLYFKIEGGSLSDTVSNLPTDGRRIYVRLYSLTSAGWKFNAYTYDALTDHAGPISVLTSPTDGSTLASSSAAFTWNAGSGTAYALWVGNTPGANDLDATLEKNGLTDTVTNLPEDGSPVYVTVWSFINGQWQNTKAHFATTARGASPKGLLTGPSPVNGSTINSGQLALNWSAGAAQGTQYALWVGSSPGAYDVYAKLEGTSLSDTVQVPVDGRRLYVVLWTYINGAWQPTTYYYDTTE